ncbi:hypothetical protein Tco_0378349 [Tanacetum coccineum]
MASSLVICSRPINTVLFIGFFRYPRLPSYVVTLALAPCLGKLKCSEDTRIRRPMLLVELANLSSPINSWLCLAYAQPVLSWGSEIMSKVTNQSSCHDDQVVARIMVAPLSLPHMDWVGVACSSHDKNMLKSFLYLHPTCIMKNSEDVSSVFAGMDVREQCYFKGFLIVSSSVLVQQAKFWCSMREMQDSCGLVSFGDYVPDSSDQGFLSHVTDDGFFGSERAENGAERFHFVLFLPTY